jgi:phosphoglycerate dehydrogenase-like enzyme
MSGEPLTIWCNAKFPEPAMAELRRLVEPHRLVFPSNLQRSNLLAGAPDSSLSQADIAFGQPDPQQVMTLVRLRWVHLTTAGYTRYDREDLRAAFCARGAILTNSSMVYAEPCAEQALAFMLALARRLPQCVDDQRTIRPWHALEHRAQCRVLTRQTVLILGFGAIARRLVELLEPFRMNVIAVRRKPGGTERCRIEPTDKVDELLPLADHVMNILPSTPQTDGFMSDARFSRMKPGAIYYNIGRGTTQDQPAIIDALNGGRIAAAYLDVTDPEPLPPEHPLWTTPNCYITPHTAGGRVEEHQSLIDHFAENLRRFAEGREMNDRIV